MQWFGSQGIHRRGDVSLSYEKPQVVDYGDLTTLTQAQGSIGAEDGVGKTVQVTVDPIVELSIGIGP